MRMTPFRVRAAAPGRPDGGGAGGSMHQLDDLFSQHRLLMESGLTHNQASLILQVSQQRKQAAAVHDGASPGTATAPPSGAAAAAGGLLGAEPAAPRDTCVGLEERVSFLELELLKQSLAADRDPLWLEGGPLSSHAAAAVPAPPTNPSGSPGAQTRGTAPAAGWATLLNPAGAGVGYLNAAAAAAGAVQQQQQQQQWPGHNADAALLRARGGRGGGRGGGGAAFPTPMPGPGWAGGVGVGSGGVGGGMSHLAAAAELGQLDPEVLALAETLAVRQGLGAFLQEEEAAPSWMPGQGTSSFGLPLPLAGSAQQQLQQGPLAGRPSSVWGRSSGSGSGSTWRSVPLQARAWGDVGRRQAGYGVADYEEGRGCGLEPLLGPVDLGEEVPYQPGGWAVVGTIAVVYLGVIATFLALCVGDVPY